jgi:hypothetical protein
MHEQVRQLVEELQTFVIWQRRLSWTFGLLVRPSAIPTVIGILDMLV